MASVHVVFEALGWAVAYALYRWQRKTYGDLISAADRRWITAAGLLGGLAGARLLHLLEDPALTEQLAADPLFVAGGKTIVGGFIGGWIAVELMKRHRGVSIATGDLLALPICIGVAVGRIGCFLTGLADGTAGIATTMPWGVDFGDGIRRHPAQLYEVAFVLVLAAVITRRRAALRAVPGDAFKLFLASYVTFRLLVDFIKPGVTIAGLTSIQWACLAVLAFYLPHLPRLAAEVRRG